MFWIQTRNALSILLFHCLLIFRAISFYFELCRGSPLFYEEENISWKIRTDALVTALSFFHNLGKLDPFQTSNFTCAESNTNERKQYIFLICTSSTFETGLKSHASCRQRAPMRQMANDQLANQKARFIQVMLYT